MSLSNIKINNRNVISVDKQPLHGSTNLINSSSVFNFSTSDIFLSSSNYSLFVKQWTEYEADKIISSDGRLSELIGWGVVFTINLSNDDTFQQNEHAIIEFDFGSQHINEIHYFNVALYDQQYNLLFGCIKLGKCFIKLKKEHILRILFSDRYAQMNFPLIYKQIISKFNIKQPVDLYKLEEANNIIKLPYSYINKYTHTITYMNSPLINVYYVHATVGQKYYLDAATRLGYAGVGIFFSEPSLDSVVDIIYPFKNLIFVVESDCYIAVSGDLGDGDIVNILEYNPLNISTRLLNAENTINEIDIDLSSYTWNAVGDSVTQNAEYLNVTKSLINLNYTNYGLGSCTIAMNNTYLQNRSIVERICGLNGNTAITDADIWTVTGGLNDCLYNSAIGVLATYGSNFDISTVYGALQKIVEYILSLRADAHLLLVEPEQSARDAWSTSDYPTSMQSIRIAFREVGAYYSVPVLRLGECCGISLYNCQRNNNPTTRDGVHLNNLGADMMGRAVAKGINDLMYKVNAD